MKMIPNRHENFRRYSRLYGLTVYQFLLLNSIQKYLFGPKTWKMTKNRVFAFDKMNMQIGVFKGEKSIAIGFKDEK